MGEHPLRVSMVSERDVVGVLLVGWFVAVPKAILASVCFAGQSELRAARRRWHESKIDLSATTIYRAPLPAPSLSTVVESDAMVALSMASHSLTCLSY